MLTSEASVLNPNNCEVRGSSPGEGYFFFKIQFFYFCFFVENYFTFLNISLKKIVGAAPPISPAGVLPLDPTYSWIEDSSLTG